MTTDPLHSRGASRGASQHNAGGGIDPVKLLLRIVVVVGVVTALCVLALVWFLSSRERVFNDYLAKLRKQGEKISNEEWVPSYSPSTNHSFETLTNLVAQLGPAPGEISGSPLAQFVEPDRARIVWSLDRPPRGTNDGTTNRSWAELGRQIETAGPWLRSLHQMLKNPDPNCGARSNFFDTPITWREQRTALDWMAYETLASLRDARRDDALASIQAVAGLANLHREEGPIYIQMTRVAVAQTGIDLTWEALQLGNWTDEQLAALQHSWESLDLLAGIERGMEGEREMLLELIAMARNRKFDMPDNVNNNAAPLPSQFKRQLTYPRWILYNDVLFGFRQQQSKVELVRRLHGGESCARILKSYRELEDEVEAKSRRVTKIFYMFSLLTIPKFSKAVESGARAEMRRRLAVVAIALRRHELKHSRLPRSLSALTPEFLRVVPGDCMDGHALKYRLNGDGTFTLYSAGLDGRDNGGDCRPIEGKRDSLDLVWPLALRPTSARSSASTSK